MRVLTLLSFIFLTACGSSSGSSSDTGADCEKAEVDVFTLTPAFSAKGSVEANVTIKDQCDDKFYGSLFALKQDVAPANCDDGTVQISKSTIAHFNGLTSGATYWVRACAYLDDVGFKSEGAVRSVTIP